LFLKIMANPELWTVLKIMANPELKSSTYAYIKSPCTNKTNLVLLVRQAFRRKK
jgi:hypothetical protein